MRASRRVTITASVLLLGCMLGSAVLLHRVDQVRTGATLQEILYITSPNVLKRMSLGYEGLLADVYWIRALQHYGYYRLHQDAPQRYRLLYPLLDLTTSLDPNFNVAYRFGAIFLSEPDPGGAGRPDLGVTLLEKGVAATPEKWQYYHDIGFIYYWHLNNPRKAAEWFTRAEERTVQPAPAADMSASGDPSKRTSALGSDQFARPPTTLAGVRSSWTASDSSRAHASTGGSVEGDISAKAEVLNGFATW